MNARESLISKVTLPSSTNAADISSELKSQFKGVRREKVDIDEELAKLDRKDRKKHRSPSVEEGDGAARAIKRAT